MANIIIPTLTRISIFCAPNQYLLTQTVFIQNIPAAQFQG